MIEVVIFVDNKEVGAADTPASDITLSELLPIVEEAIREAGWNFDGRLTIGV